MSADAAAFINCAGAVHRDAFLLIIDKKQTSQCSAHTPKIF